MAEEKRVPLFVRDATGMVRELGFWSIVIIAMSYAIGGGINKLAVEAGWRYPGSNVALGFLLGGIAVLIIAACFAILAVSMPRSGGGYVFISRIVSPQLGFVSSFAHWVGLAFTMGIIGKWVVFFFGMMLFNAAKIVHSSSLEGFALWMETETAGLVLGILIIVLITALSILPLDKILRVIQIIFIIPLVGSVITIGVYLSNFGLSAVQLQGKWDAVFGSGAYQEIMNIANQNQSEWLAPFALGATIFAGTYAALWAYGSPAAITSSVSGETKTPGRNMLWGTLVGVTFIIIIYVLLSGTMYSATDPFIRAYSWVINNASDQLKINPVLAPQQPLFAGVLSGNFWVAVIVAATAALWLLNDELPFFLFLSRTAFAWSFDRVFPEKFAEFSERFHSPVYSNLLVGAVGVLGVLLCTNWWLYVAFPGFDTLAMWLWFVMDFFLVIAAIQFPRKLPEMYERSPIKREIAGIPLISILGGIALLIEIYIHYKILSILGFSKDLALGIVILAVGFIIFYVMASQAKSKGVDLKKVYSEIPPE